MVLFGRYRMNSWCLQLEKCMPAIITKLLLSKKEMRDAGEEYVTTKIVLWGRVILKANPRDTVFHQR